MGYLRVADVGLIGGIEEDERVVLQRVVHPAAQFLLGDDGARGVIRKAEVDDIHGTALGQFGHETVLGRGGHVAHVGPTAVAIGATAAYHHIRVDIDGVDGVGHADEVVPVEQLLEVAGIALRAVIDEDLIEAEAHSARGKVVLQNSFAQEVVALLGAIAAKTFLGAHFIDGEVHGLAHGRTKGLRDITDT